MPSCGLGGAAGNAEVAAVKVEKGLRHQSSGLVQIIK
jgi:hypothetical protein